MLIDYFVKVVSRDLAKPIRQVSNAARELLMNYDWPGNVRELYSAVRYAVVNSSSGIVTEQCLPPSCSDRRGGKDHPADHLQETIPNPKDHPSPLNESSINEAIPMAEIRNLVHAGWASGSHDIYRDVMQRVDAAIVEEALRHSGGNQQLAAERLGISRPTLRSKLRAINGEPEQSQP